MIKPTREEWLAARRRAMTESDRGGTTHSIVGAVLGICPPEPAPEPFLKGTLSVTPYARHAVWVGFSGLYKPHEALTPDEADAMAEALTEHAAYAREQDGDVCGRFLGQGTDWEPICERPKGHPGVCRPHRMAGDDE